MSANATIAGLLHETAETHHVVSRRSGDDPDLESLYTDWLLDHSELTDLAARNISANLPPGSTKAWADWYAPRLAGEFGA